MSIYALTRSTRSRRGQSAVEYLLLISVVVIAIVAVAYVFIDPFQQGVAKIAQDVSDFLETTWNGLRGGNR
jgi:uncharacterized protein (UPF0333 family)